MTRALFLTVGDRTWASSRYRSYWPADYVDGWEAVQWNPETVHMIPTDFDAYIWMKTGDVAVMRDLNERGKMNFIEVCDPSWWWQPKEVRKLIDQATAIVACSEGAKTDVMEWYGDEGKPCFIIPDRLDLRHYPEKREHRDVSPVRFIWYGVAANRIALFAAMANLERLACNGVDIELTILDNAPSQPWSSRYFPIYHIEWGLDTEAHIIASHDIALLPPYPGPWGKIKTNNKQLTAWACGLPVTTGEHYGNLYYLATAPSMRIKSAADGWENLSENYQTQHTAYDWQEVFAKCTA